MTTNPVLAFWVHDWSPFIFEIREGFGPRWYGFAYLLGFAGAYGLLFAYARRGRTPLNAEKIADLILALVVGVMVGGRLGSFFLYDGWRRFGDDPLAIFRVWEGGMASHGGFVGVALALAWFARSRKVSFLHLSDVIATVTPVGLLFGRIANFINGELWGKPTTVAWAVIFPDSPKPLMPRHPSQLYEAALEGLLLFVYMQLRFWRSDAARTRPGQLAGEFLLGYAVVRIIGERFREPDEGITLILGLSRGSFFSLFLVVAGIALILNARRRKI